MKYIKAVSFMILVGCHAPEARPVLAKKIRIGGGVATKTIGGGNSGIDIKSLIADGEALALACSSDATDADAQSLKVSLDLLKERYSLADCDALSEFLIKTTIIDGAGLGLENIAFLTHMPQLTKINFNDNRISDLTPLSGLTKLKYLEIARNNLSSIKGLGTLPLIKELGLQENHITDISEIANLTNIEVLQVAENKLSDIRPLTFMKSLRTLSIHTNDIADLSPLSGLSKLEILNLQHNQAATDYSGINGLTKLRVLDISNGLAANIDFLSNLRSLEKLNLSSGTIINYAPIAKLKSLISFSIDNADNFVNNGTPFDPTLLDNSTGIQELNLVQQNLINLDFLKPFKDLKAITLDRNELLDSGISELKSHTDLVQVSCSECSLSNLDFVSGLSKIESVKVSGNFIADLTGLRGADRLKALDLGFNLDVSDISPLASIKNLETVILSNNAISDISALKSASKMTTLDISSNLVTDISSLSEMQQLTGLRMGRNPLTSLAALKRLQKLVDLNVDGMVDLQTADLIALNSLKFLSIRESELTNCDFAQKLPKLLQIDMGVNSLTNMECLRGLTNLTKVNFQSNKSPDLLPVGTLTALVDLNASDNGIKSVAALSALTKLETLALSENNDIVDLNPIKTLKGLRSLISEYSKEKPAPLWTQTTCPSGSGVNTAIDAFCKATLARQEAL